MSLDKQRAALEILLDKISHLYKNLSGLDTAAGRLELDLLRQYTKEFYEGLKSMNSAEAVPPQIATPPVFTEKPNVPASTETVNSVSKSVERLDSPPSKTVERTHLTSSKSVEKPASPPSKSFERPDSTSSKSIDKPDALPSGVAARADLPKSKPAEAPELSRSRPVEVPDLPQDPELAEDLPISTESQSINDRFSSKTDLASTINTRNKDDLRKVIDVNERFLFIRELFQGDSEAYHSAVRRLNELGNFGSADHFLKQEVSGKYEWDMEDNTVKHFLDIVRKNMAS